MKIIFQKDDLARALDLVQRAAQNKITSNTNNGIYIHAADNLVEFQANDFPSPSKPPVLPSPKKKAILWWQLPSFR